jgi:ribosome recycling factor
MVQAIEKAIMTSNLGVNPMTVGSVIRVPLPPMTQERRKEMSKIVRQEGENTKVAIRNIRRDINYYFKEQVKAKAISEDEERKAETHAQKLTDKYSAEIEAVVADKEKAMMAV